MIYRYLPEQGLHSSHSPIWQLEPLKLLLALDNCRQRRRQTARARERRDIFMCCYLTLTEPVNAMVSTKDKELSPSLHPHNSFRTGGAGSLGKRQEHAPASPRRQPQRGRVGGGRGPRGGAGSWVIVVKNIHTFLLRVIWF